MPLQFYWEGTGREIVILSTNRIESYTLAARGTKLEREKTVGVRCGTCRAIRTGLLVVHGPRIVTEPTIHRRTQKQIDDK